MTQRLALLPLLVAVALSAGCQQAVRPNLDPVAIPGAPASGGTPVPDTAAVPGASTPLVTEPGAAVLAGNPDAAVAPSEVVPTGEVVFTRIRERLSAKSCAAGSNSERWRQRYASNPTALANRLEAILPLLDFVSVEVERSGLPGEFVFIPLVESWYQPEAIGPGGPAGMWQMIGTTARNHGIHIQSGYDGRLSPVESTRAALSYLKTLQGMFGDWQATVMAYNAGEGRMMRAFKRSENRTASASQRKPHGLSNITYDYVAKLQALSCLVSEPSRENLKLPMAARFVPLSPVMIGRRFKTLEQFAASHGTDATQLRKLNPGFKSGRVVGGVPRLVLAPPGSTAVTGSDALAAVAASTESVAADGSVETSRESAATHRVRSGESLWSIARLYKVSIDQLRQVNRLRGGSVVHPGQMLKLTP